MACRGCGAELAPSFAACPLCHRLVYADELRVWAAEAEAAEREGRPDRAVELWRRALDHLPPGVRQRDQIAARLDGLSTGKPARRDGRRGGLLLGGAALAAFVLSKIKLLALGFTKLGTVLSMLAALGVYWTLWGWRFALGLLLSLYVHEIGHVAALRRLGIAASAPMFVPGLGAFVRLKQYPATVREDARVGLAGPLWGLAAALACWAIGAATGSDLFLALARTGAWINLFNLIPLGPLDGGRGFRALTRPQRFLAVAALAGAFALSNDGLVLIVLLAAVARAFLRDTPPQADRGALATYAALVLALSVVFRFAAPVAGG